LRGLSSSAGYGARDGDPAQGATTTRFFAEGGLARRMQSQARNKLTSETTMTKSQLSSCLGFGALLAFSTPALAADAPSTADVLGKLHDSNQKEIAMGKLAQKNGQSKDVTNFGKMLVKDHGAADKKVVALAKQEKIELPAPTPMKDDDMPKGTGAEFDTSFAKSMVDDHKKDIAEATTARDATTDAKLKKLLTDILPTLQKHEDTAQHIVDGAAKK
jgi:putative membrane protein